MPEHERFGSIRERNTTHERAILAASTALHEIVTLISLTTAQDETYYMALNVYDLWTQNATMKCMMLDMQGVEDIHAYDLIWRDLGELTSRLLQQLHMAIRIRSSEFAPYDDDEAREAPLQDMHYARIYFLRLRRVLVDAECITEDEANALDIVFIQSIHAWFAQNLVTGIDEVLSRMKHPATEPIGVLTAKTLEISLYELEAMENEPLN